MKITALVENTAQGGFSRVHGLSLYVETGRHKLLFDLGPDGTLFENAKMAGIDLADVDTVVLSHGHSDHGGALGQFLEANKKAMVYAQRLAFEPHFTKVDSEDVDIGLDEGLRDHPQVVLLDGDYEIDEELSLFVVPNIGKCRSTANDTLYDKDGPDTFRHEQNLVIRGEKNVLLLGCGHAGVVNILEKARRFHPDVCVGGYHLYHPRTKQTVPEPLLREIVGELGQYPDTEFYTCHCTGKVAYAYLSERMGNMHYLPCGGSIEIG